MFKKNFFIQLILFMYVGIIATSCDDGAHGGGSEEHTEAEGFVFEDENGDEIYRYFQGDVEGTLSLYVGEENALEFSVHFLDENGDDVVHVDEEEGEEYLSFSGYDSMIISIEQVDDHGDEEHCDEITDETECGNSDHCEWHEGECEDDHDAHDDHEGHDDHHEMIVKIVGIDYGTTSFKLELMHNDHPDYQTADNTPIQITVEPSGN